VNAKILHIVLIGLVMTCAGGCASLTTPQPQQLQQGLIWMFPGVEGGPAAMDRAYRGLRSGGVTAGIQVYDWNRPFGLVSNLVSYEGNRKEAARIAAEIINFARQNPYAPIDLVGYSGGGGLAVMVAEALRTEVQLRNVILAQPAISSDYNLCRALRRVDGVMVNFHSRLDFMVLGLGTRVMGTLDRRHEASAGMNGFNVSTAIPESSLRSRLVQRAWSSEMIGTGHLGGHAGMLTYGWNKMYVAPYLVTGYPAPGRTGLANSPSGR
jgi:hypothetical protein